MAEKQTKTAAQYRSHAAARQCQDCSMFRSPNRCTLVGGVISRFGTCKFWEKKGGKE